ncbi:MAG: hypothetical protein R3F22_09640 [Lysobacteraceae bacterium]
MNPASLPRDVVLPSLATHQTPGQHYALFLPPDYDPVALPERRWPVLVILDPRGRAVESLKLAVEGARRNGWVVLSSYQSRSDTQEELTVDAIRALLAEARTVIASDSRRLYFAGMSGTAKTLWGVMPSMDGVMAGMIGCGGARPTEYGRFRVSPPPFFGLAGSTDFNYGEMHAQEDLLAKTDTPHRLDVFAGGHGWPQEVTDFTRAIDWLQLMAIRDGRVGVDPEFIAAQRNATESWIGAAADALERLRRTEQAIRDFDGLVEVDGWRSSLRELTNDDRVKALRKQQKKLDAQEARFARDFDTWFTRFAARFEEGRRLPPPDAGGSLRELRIAALQKEATGNDRRDADSASRRLERAYVATSFYLPNAMTAMGDTERAALSLEIAMRIFPDRAGPHWQLAALHARDGSVDKAFRELHRSRDLGYLDAGDLRRNSDWSSLREDGRWNALLERADTTAHRH